jgi:thioredoxin reductase (NADPH)
MEKVKVVIVGSGPAGYTAAVYAARADLEPILFEGFFSGLAGGQLMTTTDVENYPGFPEGVSGPKMMELFRQQAKRFGTKCHADDVTSVDLKKHPYTVHGKKTSFRTETLIIATGATARRLEIPGAGDGEYWQRGVTACAVCDGAMPIFRNRPLYVIGGGDTAMEEALFLTRYGSKVYIVHRRDELRASKIMSDRATAHPKIEIVWDSVVVAVEGNTVVHGVKILNLKTKKETAHDAGGLFFAVGHEPNTGFLKGQVKLHDNGYIWVKPGTCQTSVEGVFACGDVQDHIYRQAVTAAGTGCMAALEAERWLSAREHMPT